MRRPERRGSGPDGASAAGVGSSGVAGSSGVGVLTPTSGGSWCAAESGLVVGVACLGLVGALTGVVPARGVVGMVAGGGGGVPARGVVGMVAGEGGGGAASDLGRVTVGECGWRAWVGVVCGGTLGTICNCCMAGVSRAGMNFLRNFLFLSVTLRDPSIRKAYWLNWRTSIIVPVLSHLSGCGPVWFCTLTWSPTFRGGSCLV